MLKLKAEQLRPLGHQMIQQMQKKGQKYAIAKQGIQDGSTMPKERHWNQDHPAHGSLAASTDSKSLLVPSRNQNRLNLLVSHFVVCYRVSLMPHPRHDD